MDRLAGGPLVIQLIQFYLTTPLIAEETTAIGDLKKMPERMVAVNGKHKRKALRLSAHRAL